jgi:hypothetical protein
VRDEARAWFGRVVVKNGPQEPFRNLRKRIEALPTYRCPCCKFKALRGRGMDEICKVCFWHDDGQDEHDAEVVRGGPNRKLSLRQVQKNFEQCGASNPQLAARARAPFPSER